MKYFVYLSGIALAALTAYLFISLPDVVTTELKGDNIICFGDSLTYGTGASKGMDYPAQLSRMIGVSIINAGVPGDTTASALKRLELDVLSKSPRIVLITLGGNDLKNGVSRDTAFNNLAEIIKKIQSEKALPVLGGIRVAFWDRGFGNSYKKLSEESGALLVDNIFEGIMGNDVLMSDSIHPNSSGYTIIARRFHESIKPYLVGE